jgi:uncharacterized delta-60 repeat protein
MSLADHAKRIGLSVAIAFLAVPSLLLAQPGSLDPSFGSDGIVTTPGTTFGAAALESNGKIVVVGGSSTASGPAVVRYNANGSLDSTFGTAGQVTFNLDDSGAAFAVAIQSDGKILFAAPDELQLDVFRLNTNGSLDTSFGSSGLALVPGAAPFLTPASGTIALLADGKILVIAQNLELGGTFFERLLSNGTPDSSFGTNGAALLVASGQKLALQPSGQILVLNPMFDQGAVSRYNANGSLDGTFGGAGQAAGYGTGAGLAVIESSSEFIVAGSLFTPPLSPAGNNTGFLLVRYSSNGSIDTTFGTNGVTTTSFPGNLSSAAAAVALQSNGDIVAGGSTAATSTSTSVSDFALARYTASGTLDTTFGASGLVTTAIGSKSSAINTLLIQDGKILALGTSSEGTTIARYLSE